jgi:Mg-chelatase subunit ChlD
MTDIWSGLEKSLDSLREGKNKDSKRIKTVMLLTDGVPNVSPKAGHIQELKNYKD